VKNTNTPSSGEAAVIDSYVNEYLATHPNFEFPKSGDRHPSVLAIGNQMKGWLMDRLGGPVPYWRAMLESANTWFPPGCESREFRIFCTLIEGEERIWWQGRPEFEPVWDEYAAWKKRVKSIRT
jgi:hypothetical protein